MSAIKYKRKLHTCKSKQKAISKYLKNIGVTIGLLSNSRQVTVLREGNH